jgi:glycosyltransferase involved in cell wall biosynthesis
MDKGYKVTHVVDFENKNLWFEEYLDLISAFGVEQEIVILSDNQHLRDFAKNRDLVTKGGFEFLLKSLFESLKRKGPGFVIAHGYVPSIFSAALVPLCRVKLIIVHHHQPNFFSLLRSRSYLKGLFHGTLLRFTYKMSFKIQSFSKEVYESLVFRGVPEDKIFVNPIGINLNKLRNFLEPSGNTERQENDDKIVVSVSRLSWEKDLALAIKAVALARDGGMQVRYQIYGEGPERTTLQALILDLNANDYITLMGFSTEIFEAIGSSDLFLHTSKTESFGQVIFEAYAIGVPVLTSRVGVAIDLFDKNSDRIHLISVCQPRAVAKQICEVLDNQVLKMRSLEDTSLLQQHSIEKSTSELISFLRTSL